MLSIGLPALLLPEQEYTLRLLFTELLGLPVQFVPHAAPHYRVELPNGNTLTLEDHFFTQNTAEGYLHSRNIYDQPVLLPHPFRPGETLPVLYGRPELRLEEKHITLGADLIASAFFMLARWEELVRPERDALGRFPAGAALAARAGFLDRPVVNEYAELLAHLLRRLGQPVQYPRRAERLLLSCDVDHPRLWWRPADRLRTLSGSLLRGGLRETAWWLRHRLLRPGDPYDAFDAFMTLAEPHNLRWQFNFLGRRAPNSDAYYPLDHSYTEALIRRIEARGHHIGFHPSLEAYEKAELFDQELKSLQEKTTRPITAGRHHYLRFAAPHTWQRWADAGLTLDGTLGYPEAEGFRAGICQSYPVFNVLTRRTLPLREQPLIAMDVTLALHRRYTPAQALDRLRALRAHTQRHGGEFTLLWHNSSWNTYFWAPWQTVLQKTIGATPTP